jgi:outer membrane lipoprotein-sorting protein
MTDEADDELKLARAVDALREWPVPDGPDESSRQRLVDRLTADERAPLSVKSQPELRRLTMPRIFGIAASVLVVALVIGWLASPDSPTAGAAFARMLEQVANARTIVFKNSVEVGESRQGMHGTTMVLEPDWIRGEVVEGENKYIHIQNLKQHKWLTLIPATKKARLVSADEGSGVPTNNFIDQLREVRESSAKFLGKEKINGAETLKYHCDHPSGHYLMWIDPQSDLPVKVVMSEAKEGHKAHVTITLTDFQWNTPLDESLFTFDLPAGYELEEQRRIGSVLDPENFIKTLKAYVRLNNDEFPDEYNALTPGSIVQFLDDPTLPDEQRMTNYRRKLAYAMELDMEKMSQEDWQKQGTEIGRVFAQGAVFLQVLSQTHQWHYLGKGVKLGEADKIVAWWAPKAAGEKGGGEQSKSATVLFGDLHIENKPVAGLPVAD